MRIINIASVLNAALASLLCLVVNKAFAEELLPPSVKRCYLELKIEENAPPTSAAFSIVSVAAVFGDYSAFEPTSYEYEPIILETRNSAGAVLKRYGLESSRNIFFDGKNEATGEPEGGVIEMPSSEMRVFLSYDANIAVIRIGNENLGYSVLSLNASQYVCGQ